jgi:hypothetical protein
MEQNLFPETKTETNKRETIPAQTEDRVPAVPSVVTNEFDTFTPVNTKSKDWDCGELTSKMTHLLTLHQASPQEGILYVSVNLLKGLLNSKNISNLDRLLCCVTDNVYSAWTLKEGAVVIY